MNKLATLVCAACLAAPLAQAQEAQQSKRYDVLELRAVQSPLAAPTLVYSLPRSRNPGVATGIRGHPEDVAMLQSIMGLSDVQVGALYAIRRRLGRSWIARLLRDERPEEMQDMIDSGLIHEGTLGAIQRKLSMFQRFGFLRPNVQDNVVEKLLGFINQGVNVVLEFGRYGLDRWRRTSSWRTTSRAASIKPTVERKEAAQGGGRDEPKPLVITIEEAHKFLDPEIAAHTIFGTIARELRKYNVTLLIVDQRPSGIEEEVMSQIGTRVTCLLDGEQDIRAGFSGISGAGELRQVLARLDTRQQALILGHAVPMPVVVKTRQYDEVFYAAATPSTAPSERSLQGVSSADSQVLLVRAARLTARSRTLVSSVPGVLRSMFRGTSTFPTAATTPSASPRRPASWRARWASPLAALPSTSPSTTAWPC